MISSLRNGNHMPWLVLRPISSGRSDERLDRALDGMPPTYVFQDPDVSRPRTSSTAMRVWPARAASVIAPA